MSKLELGTNKQIILVFVIQVVLCLIGAFVGSTWMVINRSKVNSYLVFELKGEEPDPWSTNWGLLMLKTTGTWILIFTNFVPISLLVTLEVVKFWQAIFISWDWTIFD